jgi:hypothetical protein
MLQSLRLAMTATTRAHRVSGRVLPKSGPSADDLPSADGLRPATEATVTILP